MAIDPEMYKKYNGKSGDVERRMAGALTESATRKVQRDAKLSDDAVADGVSTYYKWKFALSAIGAILLLIALATGLIRVF